MLNFFSIVADFRAARAALAARDFPKVAALAADLLETLGMAALAEHVRGELAAIGTGDARGIAENALGVVADLLNAAFAFGKPLTVGATAPTGDPEAELAAKCDAAIAHCEAAHAPQAMAAGPDGVAAIDPATILNLIALFMPVFVPVFEWLLAAFRNRRPVVPA